ncbi:MAG: hypothetical protein ACRET5_15725 [Steroidobacteraceae bacterium]
MRPTTLCWSAAAVAGTTALGVAAACADPALAGNTPPHPALAGTVADATSVFIDNARVLSAPYLLWVLRAPRSRAGRVLGDVLLSVIVVGNTVPVGLELGRWQARLIPYVPQLPIEWTALAIALGAWLAIRTGNATGRTVLILAAGAAVLLAVAAALETWDTPHPARHTAQSRTVSDAGDQFTHPSGCPGGGCLRRGFCTGGGHAASRSHAPFPSRCSVPLGHSGRCKPGYINHPRTPDRRDQKMNNMCVIWNCLQIAHSVGVGCSASTAESDRCRC